jgi:glycosyltransferase involved in cell wall biosynthesis
VRIGIDASSLPTTVAGAGRYICSLIRALAQIDHNNEYVIFAKAGTQNLLGDLPAENFRFTPLPNFSRPARLLWQHCGAGLHGHHDRIDIWHGLHYSLPYFAGPARTVSTFHDVAFFLHPRLYPPIKRLYFQQTIRRALATADAIVTVSQSTADDMRRLFNGSSGFDDRKLRVVHSGVEARFFSHVCAEQIERIKMRYGLNSPYLLFIGTGEKRKNLPLLIEAFSRLRQRGHQDLLLALAGQPDNGRAEVERMIARENLQDAVRCLGYVPDADILPLYHGTQLLVLPSVHEGFGFPLLEAMAGGVPVLAADNSAMRELAVDAEMLCAGDAETWAQKIERLLVDNGLRQELIVRGRQHARTFSWQQTAQATLAVYESLQPPSRHAMPVRIVRACDLKSLASSAATRNGIVPVMKISSSNGYSNGFEKISAAALKTLAYADLFDYPLRADEVHEGLLDCGASFEEVLEALEMFESRGVIARAGPLFFLSGREKLVAVRDQRRQQTRGLLQKHAWLVKLVIKFPFVRSVSLSGAAAFENSHQRDDIDLFVITAGKRLWSVYTVLALLLKLMGKRRLLCLNCLVDLDHLRLDEGDFFIAHQIAFLRPLSGIEHLKKFHAANAWISSHLPQSRLGSADSLSAKTLALFANDERPKSFWLKNFLETIWSWGLFDYLERLIFGFYRRHIRRLTQHTSAAAVVVEPGQIKLFTNNHRQRIKSALQQRVKQILTTEFLEAENETSQAVF